MLTRSDVQQAVKIKLVMSLRKTMMTTTMPMMAVKMLMAMVKVIDW